MAKNETEACMTIEHWQKTLGIAPAVHAGVTIQQGWLSGRMVTQTEYKAAMAKFLTGNGRRTANA